MPTFSLQEKPDSREVGYQPPSITLTYTASGEPDQDTVFNNCLSALPPTMFTNMGQLYLQDIRLKPRGWALFDVEAPYAPGKKMVGSYTFSFDTTGGTTKRYCSLTHLGTYYPSGSTGDSNPHKGMINTSIGKDPEGVDVVTPALKFTVTFRAAQGIVTMDYARALAGATGCTNTDTFGPFQAGEVLFLGATGSDGSESESEVAYQFSASQNAADLTVSNISGIDKPGQAYAWVESQKSEDSTGAGCVTPMRVHVEQVFPTISFSDTFGWSL